MGIDEAITQFRHAAIEKAEYASPASKDHALHAAMCAAWKTLEAHGERGRKAFRSLLTDESLAVKCWVAAQLLALGDEAGLHVLETGAADRGLRGLSSRMVLEEWRAGRLRPPFGDVDA